MYREPWIHFIISEQCLTLVGKVTKAVCGIRVSQRGTDMKKQEIIANKY